LANKAVHRAALVAQPLRGGLDDSEHSHAFRGVPMIGAQEERFRSLVQDVGDPGERTFRTEEFE
jgi:hypothetical protein